MAFLQKLFPKRDQQPDDYEIEEQASIGSSTGQDVTRYILETYDILEEFEQKMRGRIWNPRTRNWEKKGRALMNDLGASRMMLWLSNFVNRHIALSNFDTEDIKRIAFESRIELIKLLRLEWINFEMEKSMLGSIIRMCDATIFSMLKRAYRAGERTSLGQRYMHVEGGRKRDMLDYEKPPTL
jgi:hypothetical protein